jgi:hypothetical protein
MKRTMLMAGISGLAAAAVFGPETGHASGPSFMPKPAFAPTDLGGGNIADGAKMEPAPGQWRVAEETVGADPEIESGT